MVNFVIWFCTKLKILDLVVQKTNIYQQLINYIQELENANTQQQSVITSLETNDKEIKDIINKVADTIINLSSKGTETNEKCGNITNYLTNISSVSEELSAVNEETAASNEELATQITHIETLIKNIVGKALNISSNSIENKDLLQKNIELMQTNYETFSTRIKNIIKFAKDKVNDVENMTQIIISLAGEVKLLSLNAAIEAARAGQAGRGFSVVANEMSKLASSSEASATKVLQQNKEIVTAIQQLSNTSEEILNYISTDVVSITSQSYSSSISNIENINNISEDLKSVSLSSGSITISAQQQVITSQQQANGIFDLAESLQSVTHDINVLLQITEETKQLITDVSINILPLTM